MSWPQIGDADIEAHLVLADQLMRNGDPRGELIVVQAERLRSPEDPKLAQREAELLEDHHDTFLGPLGHLLDVQWSLGFWRRVRFPTEDISAPDMRELAAMVFSHDSAAQLRAMWITSFPGGFEGIARLWLEAPRRPRLGGLTIGEPHYHDLLSFPDGFDFSTLRHLRSLELLSGRVRIASPLDLPHLKKLDVRGVLPRTHEFLFSTAWPSVQEMRLRLWHSEGDGLRPATLPELRRLDLDVPHVSRFVAFLQESELIEQLAHLGFPKSPLGVRDLESLLLHSPVLSRIPSFTLQRPRLIDRITDEHISELEGALPNLTWLDTEDNDSHSSSA